jgi:hypothetical protein
MKPYLPGTLLILALGAGAYWYFDTPSRQIKATIRAQLSDPDSAQFRNIRKGNDSLSWCGEVNAKNRLGGFVGFTRFAAVHVADTWSVHFVTEANPFIDSESARKVQQLNQELYRESCETIK